MWKLQFIKKSINKINVYCLQAFYYLQIFDSEITKWHLRFAAHQLVFHQNWECLTVLPLCGVLKVEEQIVPCCQWYHILQLVQPIISRKIFIYCSMKLIYHKMYTYQDKYLKCVPVWFFQHFRAPSLSPFYCVALECHGIPQKACWRDHTETSPFFFPFLLNDIHFYLQKFDPIRN